MVAYSIVKPSVKHVCHFVNRQVRRVDRWQSVSQSVINNAVYIRFKCLCRVTNTNVVNYDKWRVTDALKLRPQLVEFVVIPRHCRQVVSRLKLVNIEQHAEIL